MAYSATQSVGRRGERLALGFLKKRGLRLVTQNFSCRFGEIDLIMQDGHCLVFVEVRFRGGRRYSTAAQTVDYRKQGKLIRTASFYVSRNQQWADSVMRFDVLAIDNANNRESIDWLRDAFRPQ